MRSNARQKTRLENPIAPVKAKAAYSAPLCRYIAHHKTVAVAEGLLASPRTAQEVLVTGLMRHLKQDEAFRSLAKEAEHQSPYRALPGGMQRLRVVLRDH